MKIRLLLTLAGLAISFAVPASMAQDAMKVVTADELVWKEHPLFKGAVNVLGDPTKAETIILRVKSPHFKVPPHTHPYSEVVTVGGRLVEHFEMLLFVTAVLRSLSRINVRSQPRILASG